MPLVDMPLEELMKYEGKNPCPADMDEFWDRSIGEMHGLDDNVELRKAEFTAAGAECRDLFFSGTGGARVHAKYLRPKGKGPFPAVVIFHGYSGNSGGWMDKLAWVGEGFCVAAMDCRGQGGISEDVGGVKGTTFRGHIIRGLDEEGPEKLLFRDIFLDTAQLARVVMGFEEVDEKRVGATGGSQGGALTLACAALEPGIKRAAPVVPFLCDYKRVWEMDLAANAYEELKTYFRQYDPEHKREEEIFTRLGYIDAQHLAKRIKGEIFMGTGLMDTICPPSTQFAAYNRITSKKSVAIYPDYGHETPPSHADKVFEFMRGL
ncbi:MAG: acetylxylan esterase [Planctomycetes bacterium]|nr:acetylxylan esterase [Planctomycetota bacterium]